MGLGATAVKQAKQRLRCCNIDFLCVCVGLFVCVSIHRALHTQPTHTHTRALFSIAA